MRNIRVIARLDIKGPNLIKGVHLEGLRVVGDPIEFAAHYYREGIDEILFMDSVASLYGRNHLAEIISLTANDIFVPITVGGGIRTVKDAKDVLKSGADKIAINSAAVARPALIKEIAEDFGSQATVLSIEAKKNQNGSWEVYTDNGREKSGLLVSEWVEEAASLGAGEVLVTSIDKEGTGRGFDIELMRQISKKVTVPIIASGGMGKISDIHELISQTDISAVAIANSLHYRKISISEIKKEIALSGFKVRI
ncbi:cyclase [Candidatus Planktophila dulcis]|uniref:imidazole glycerol-phosphate synthase n=1 Tax=Candidatus Planktophila dulcis TaxID=1884914 RepID=A0AAC9YSL3_9ACTN|nr:imidazole glycerol phosphate synthase cyclase subunit [Candidatus Planktophila dulcis]ASY11439.1 cyclase [Candidatus Planktophila dulcis]